MTYINTYAAYIDYIPQNFPLSTSRLNTLLAEHSHIKIRTRLPNDCIYIPRDTKTNAINQRMTHELPSECIHTLLSYM